MKKKLLSALLCAAMAVMMTTGCGKAQAVEISSTEQVRENNSAEIEIPFEHIACKGFYNSDVYKEVYTDVLYLTSGSGSSVSLTVMLDPATGLPLTYTNYVENYYQK